MPEIPRLSVDEIDVASVLAEESPIIVAGEANAWPAATRWTWDMLRERYPDTWVPARHGNDVDLYKRRMRALVDEILAGEAVYGIDWDFTADHPELGDDIPRSVLGEEDVLLEIPEPDRTRFFWMYLGAAGTGSALHQDVLQTHAWLALIQGNKRWVQYAPDDFTREEGKVFDAFGDGAIEEDERRGRVRWTAEVGAGDVMFVPSLWWHQVENLTPTISITANFAPRALIPRVREEANIGRYQALVPYLDLMLGQ